MNFFVKIQNFLNINEWKLFIFRLQTAKNRLGRTLTKKKKLTTSSPKLFEKSSGEWVLLWGFELPWDIQNKNTKDIKNIFTVEKLSQHTEAIFII